MFKAFLFTVLLAAFSCSAQTNNWEFQVYSNGVPILIPLPSSLASLPPSTAADWAKSLGDVGIHVTAGTMVIALAILIPLFKALCGYARKAIPLSAQVNNVGLLLAHGAGIDNPTLAMLQAAADASPPKAASTPSTPQAGAPPTP